jgi:putative ABC transport system permease protein
VKKHTSSGLDAPQWILTMLRWFCPPQLHESIEGDLIEEFQVIIQSENSDKSALRKAKIRLFFSVLRFFRPGILLRNRFTISLTTTIMLSNYLRVAARNIAKRKTYSFINAFGLSVAIAFCSLIYLYVEDERNFDQFHEKKESILRIYNVALDREKWQKKDPDLYRTSAWLPAKLGEIMLDELPEVVDMTRFNRGSSATMRYGDEIFKQRVSYADSGFFKMFTFPIKVGNPHNPLRFSSDAVITTEVATRFFGDEDPIGKTFELDLNETKTFTVAAVAESPPSNSSIAFEIIIGIGNQPGFEQNREQWGSFAYPTFVEVKAGTDLSLFQTKLDTLVSKHLGSVISSWWKDDDIPDNITLSRFTFDTLPEVHLNSKVDWEQVSDPKYSWILSGIAALILFIAIINYINLSLTTSAGRRIEVGIRKTIGATRHQLVSQFSLESVVLALMSMVIGLLLAVTALPWFNEFTQKTIHFTVESFPKIFLVVFSITVLTGLLAGSYPALFLSRFQPVKALKGALTSKMNAGFTKPLVVLQFALSAFLVISSVIMFRQMKLVTTKDLGYNKDQVITIQTSAGWGDRATQTVSQFRNSVGSMPEIVNVAGTSASFNRGWAHYGYRINDTTRFAYVYRVDEQYVPLLGIDLAAGRNFDESRPSDKNAIIVNEALVKEMGWSDPLNAYLNYREDSTGLGAKVIGVAKDYHFLSLERKIEPMFLMMEDRTPLTTVLVKISSDDIPGTIEKLKATWKSLYPDRAFEYSFLDDDVSRQYTLYERWTSIMALATVFAIIIACLGLFGLAGVNALNKTREIGIRKVMGADELAIFVMLNRQYVILSIIAFGIAAPVSYYTMQKWWLSGFAEKAVIGWEIFTLSVIGGLLISLGTVTYHGVKAAGINPATTLKCE